MHHRPARLFSLWTRIESFHVISLVATYYRSIVDAGIFLIIRPLPPPPKACLRGLIVGFEIHRLVLPTIKVYASRLDPRCHLVDMTHVKYHRPPISWNPPLVV
ncbi:hypothetical protein GW17_00038939 [Ensete ventricosum]|nr:hypothetical protein GW17_00038939 [Ensete ventricosum]